MIAEVVLEKPLYRITKNRVVYAKNGFHLHFPYFFTSFHTFLDISTLGQKLHFPLCVSNEIYIYMMYRHSGSRGEDFPFAFV